ANEILHHKLTLNGYMSQFTGQSMETITRDTDRDFFMSPQEAIEYGLIDALVSKPLPVQMREVLAGRSRSHQIPPAMRDVSGALHSGPDGVLKAMTESFNKLYGGETKLSDETLNQLENDIAAFELTRATEVDEAHGRPPDLAETEAF
ncbi:hypothetical protein FOA52_002154, partial [Chlamydomonas sp. UWO 241]